MALTANRNVDHYVDRELRTFPLAAGVRVYRGGLLGVRYDGYVRGWLEGDRFCGLAYEECDNSAGACGARQVRAYTAGDFALPLAGVHQGCRLQPVYATDDETLTLSPGLESGCVGRVLDVVATGLALVRLKDPGAEPVDHPGAQVNLFEDFLGASLNVTDGRWRTVEVGDASAALVANAHAGELALSLAATDEAEDAVLYQGDTTAVDIDSKPVFECRARVATPGSGVTAVFGLAGDHHLDKDSVARHAWFRLEGGLDLLVETDDGTIDNDDADTLLNLTSGTYYTFRIDLADPAEVKFFVDGQRVLADTTFDMSNFTGRLQPYLSLDKSAGTGTATLTVDWLRVTATRA